MLHKRQFLLLSFGFFFSLSLFAQGIPTSGFGIEVYPHIANRRLISGGLTFAEVNRIDSLETATNGIGIGIFYSQRTEKFGYQIGLRYLRTGYDRDRGPLDEPGDFNEFSEQFRATLLEIPFQMNFYQNIGTKSAFYFTLGMAAGINVDNSTERTLFNGNDSETIDFDTEADYRRLNFALITAVGYETTFTNRWTLGLQPTFEYWLSGNEIAEASGLNRNLFNLGLRLTLRRERL